MQELNEPLDRAPTSSLDREREYYEQLYSGFAQQHFAKPAVASFRKHLVRRIVRLTGANRDSRVLSLGAGTGDTELLLAPHVGSILGIDISPRGVEHAVRTAASSGIQNARFVLGELDDVALGQACFNIIIAVFFLHHLPERIDHDLPPRIYRLLKPGGVFYALDPSHRRLSGRVGKLLFPSLIKKYQTADEQPLDRLRTAEALERAGFQVRTSFYDFISTPLAGLLPSSRGLYLASRRIDDLLVKLPLIRLLSSNFEILACKPRN